MTKRDDKMYYLHSSSAGFDVPLLFHVSSLHRSLVVLFDYLALGLSSLLALSRMKRDDKMHYYCSSFAGFDVPLLFHALAFHYLCW